VTLRGSLRVLHALSTDAALRAKAATSEGLECSSACAVAFEVLTSVTLEAVAAGALSVLVTPLFAHTAAVARVDCAAIDKADKLALVIRGGALLVAAVVTVPLVIVFVASAHSSVNVACALATARQGGIVIRSHADHLSRLLVNCLGAAHILALVLGAVV